MDIQLLEHRLVNNLEQRKDELEMIEKLSTKLNLSEHERLFIIKYATPIIYSIWEGFVKEAFRTYIEFINAQQLMKNELHLMILTHALDAKFEQIKTGVSDMTGKIKFINDIDQFMTGIIAIDLKLPTESNINFTVLNGLLNRFNLEPLSAQPFKKHLDRLLTMRNDAAHGDHTIPKDQIMVTENVDNIAKLMNLILERIIDGCSNKTYLKS